MAWNGIRARPRLVACLLTLCLAGLDIEVLGVSATHKVLLYEAILVGTFGLALRRGLPATIAGWLTGVRATVIAAGIVTTYGVAELVLGVYCVSHSVRIKGDFGIFLQSQWWTVRGLPLFNTFEGTSHLGIHGSFILLALTPLFAAWPSWGLLILVQAASVSLGGWVFFIIARRYLDAYTSLCLLLAFLLFPAYQYRIGDFYESSIAIPFLLLTIDSGLREWRYRFLLWATLLLAVRESFALMLVAFGCYLLATNRRHTGVLAAILGAAWFVVVTSLVEPWFRTAFAAFPPFDQYAAPFARFGHSPSAIAVSVLTRPSLVVATVFTPEKLHYLASLVAPYLLIGFLGSMLWIIALPELGVSLLSGNVLIGDRFAVVTCAALALSVVFTVQRLDRSTLPKVGGLQALAASVILLSTLMLLPEWVSADAFTPVTGATDIRTILQRVGPSASAAVPYQVAEPFAQRSVVFESDVNSARVVLACSQYVVVHRDHRERSLLRGLAERDFSRTWSGSVYELWKSRVAPACDPHRTPWVR